MMLCCVSHHKQEVIGTKLQLVTVSILLLSALKTLLSTIAMMRNPKSKKLFFLNCSLKCVVLINK